jgi:hypothetical protein
MCIKLVVLLCNYVTMMQVNKTLNSSRFIQTSETSSNNVKNTHTLSTFSTAFLPGKMHAYPLRMGLGRDGQSRIEVLCETYFCWTILKHFSGECQNIYLSFQLFKVYQNETDTTIETTKFSGSMSQSVGHQLVSKHSASLTHP